jgi:hypothetical protein
LLLRKLVLKSINLRVERFLQESSFCLVLL